MNNHEYVSMHLDLMGQFSVFNEALARVGRARGEESGSRERGPNNTGHTVWAHIFLTAQLLAVQKNV